MKELNLQSYYLHRHDGVPIAIGIWMKVETKEARPDDPRLNDSVGQAVGRGERSEFIIQLLTS